MATLAQIRRFIEGTDLLGQVQRDVKEIESGNINSILSGWNDLTLELPKVAEYSDLFSDPYSMNKNFLSRTIGDAQTYLQNATLEIEQPNSPGNYINLYAGSDSMVDGEINETFNDQDAYGNPIPVTLWEVVNNPSLSLVNNYSDAEWNSDYGKQGHQGGLNTDWGNSSNFSWYDMSASSGDGTMWSSAQGSLSQWSSFIHLANLGDPSALNNDAYLLG